MQIWVDADACPRVIKEILYRAANRLSVQVTFVANLPLRTPKSQYIDTIQVPGGFDVADSKIIELVQDGDLVISADIPLVDEVIKKGAFALNPRGTFYTKDNIGEYLTLRNLSAELRGSGVETGGPSTISSNDRNHFANQLDRFLTQEMGILF